MKWLMAGVMALLAALLVAAATASPAAAGEPAAGQGGRILLASGGDLVVAAGERAEAVIVIQGHADIRGEVSTVVVIDGTATVTGTTIESLVVVRGSAVVTGTHVRGDIRTFDGQVTQSDVVLDGSVRGLEADFVALGWALGVGALLVWLGIGLATLVAGLAVATLAGRQLRTTAEIVRREPLRAVGGGLIGLIVPILLVAALFVTVIGIPMAVSILLLVWPASAFVGYLVAAAWLGGLVLDQFRGPRPEPERPYAAVVVGLLVLFVAGVVPLLGAILSFLGFGAVVVAAWRTARGVSVPLVPSPPTPAPVAG
jgi:hypothetical protein